MSTAGLPRGKPADAHHTSTPTATGRRAALPVQGHADALLRRAVPVRPQAVRVEHLHDLPADRHDPVLLHGPVPQVHPAALGRALRVLRVVEGVAANLRSVRQGVVDLGPDLGGSAVLATAEVLPGHDAAVLQRLERAVQPVAVRLGRPRGLLAQQRRGLHAQQVLHGGAQLLIRLQVLHHRLHDLVGGREGHPQLVAHGLAQLVHHVVQRLCHVGSLR